MADPFSLAASVLGVAATAATLSKKLHDLAQTFEDAPRQLDMLADQIAHNGTLLKFTVHLIKEHSGIFKEELRGIVHDVNGQFSNINSLFEKIFLPSRPRQRRRDKLKAMVSAFWSSKKIEELMVELEALRSTLALILSVAQLAEAQISRQVIYRCLKTILAISDYGDFD